MKGKTQPYRLYSMRSLAAPVSYAHGPATPQSLLHPIARPIRRLMATSSTAESAIIAPTMSSPPA